MKRKNFKRKIFSCIAICSIFIGSLLVNSHDSQAISAAGDPVIVISAPSDGAVFDVPTVTFTGTISDDTTAPDQLSIKVFEQQSTDILVDITLDGKLSVTNAGEYADFSYSKDFSVGAHTLQFVVTDKDGANSKVTQTFTINQATTDQANTASTTTTLQSGGTTALSQTLAYVIDPKILSDITNKDSAFEKYKFEKDSTDYSSPENKRQRDYVHGNFSVVTASCSYCHDTHNGDDEYLAGGKFGDTNKNACMGCHDGNISTAVDLNSTGHAGKVDPDYTQTSKACTSCHNPHASMTEDNPYLEYPPQ